MVARFHSIRFRHRQLAPVAAVAFVACLLVSVAYACNVPVFRFALERWRADAYRVTVVHQGPLSQEQKQALTALEERQEKSQANLIVRAIDAAELEEADQKLLQGDDRPQLPLLVVQYPEALQMEAPIWSQPLTAAASKQLLDSPLRHDLLNRLVDGETAVWLLLECSNAERNKAAADLLGEQLKKLEKELQLPELTDLPDDNLVAKTPLKLSFSMMRIQREGADVPLVQMLVHSEEDLRERDDPMIFPVFGRGRALLPLIGAGITADNIKNSAAFLVGACSCEVKELNPGFDLLLAADWDELLSPNGEPLPIVPTKSLPTGEVELVPIPAGSKAAAPIATATTVTSTAAATGQRAATPPRRNTAIYTIIAITGAVMAWIVLANMSKAKPV